jgi:hypothetical protein
MIRRVEVGENVIRIHLHGSGCRLFAQLGPVAIADALRPVPIAVEIPLDIQTLPADGLPPEPANPHSTLIKIAVRGYLWRTELVNGTIKTADSANKKGWL